MVPVLIYKLKYKHMYKFFFFLKKKFSYMSKNIDTCINYKNKYVPVLIIWVKI